MDINKIVEDLVYDMSFRIGLNQEWEKIDKVNQDEIKKAWVNIIISDLKIEDRATTKIKEWKDRKESYDKEVYDACKSKDNKEECSACKYWNKMPGDIGQCRRHVPTHSKTFHRVWVETKPDDWCGEFRNEVIDLS